MRMAADTTGPSRTSVWHRPLAVPLDLVDGDFAVAALGTVGPGPGSGRHDLLLIEPLGRRVAPVLEGLAEATGQALRRLRFVRADGGREVARIDELALPATPGLPRMVRHLSARRLDPVTPSPTLARLWQQSRLAVLWLDELSPAQAEQHWHEVVSLVRLLGALGPRWVVRGAPAGAGPVPAPVVLAPAVLAQAPGAERAMLWQTVLADWAAWR